MSQIHYRPIVEADEVGLVAQFGDYLLRYHCLHFSAGCYSVGAFEGDRPVGLVSTYPLAFPPPLNTLGDAFIDVLDVTACHRRRGIASQLIAMTEAWAREQGFRQIRSWSSDDKSAAIPMWYALGYGVCPAWMRGESLNPAFAGRPIPGFYVVKVL